MVAGARWINMGILFYQSQITLNSFWISAAPGWLSGARVVLMTWWLWIRFPVEKTFLSGLFSPLISAKVAGGFGKKSCVGTGESQLRRWI